MRALLLSLLFIATASAATPDVQRDLFYTDAKDKLQSLDVYSPADGKDHPIVVWIHGGGWRKGDKAGLQKKPQAFTDKGCVLVSINYRFIPDVPLKDMMADVAKAIRFVHGHAAEYRGDPNRIVVIGHSAGAHLAALICTDDHYLKAEGMTLAPIKGCVPIDVSVYDLPKRLKDGGQVSPDVYVQIFGETEAAQREYSPVYHVAKDKHIPAFLILHVADRDDTKAQSHWFASKLKDADIAADVVAGEGKTHGTISSDLGGADDPPTIELWKFLKQVVALP